MNPPRPPVQPVLMPLDDPHRQLARQLVESGPADTVLEPRDRRLRGQRLAGDRVPPEQQLVDRVVGEVVDDQVNITGTGYQQTNRAIFTKFQYLFRY